MADFSSLPFPKRLITMDMPDKYMALCFIFEGIQYQNLCRKENPDGTFNYSANCLAELPFFAPHYLAGSTSINTSSSSASESGLVRYDPSAQSPMPPLGQLLAYYWLQIVMYIICLGIVIYPLYRYATRNKDKKMATVDKDGNVTLGKISYEPSNQLGRGSRGTFVFKGKFEGKQTCAVKRVVAQSITIADREITFLRSLQHTNLVRYLATEKDVQFIYIALELAEFTLRQVVDNKQIAELGLSKEEVCKQAALGLKYLHDSQIIHRDIKPENILISYPKIPHHKRSVMISDFGLSKELSLHETYHTSGAMRYYDGTFGWLAPEILKAREMSDKLKPSKSADIFSLGCVFYYIIFDGKHPFGELEDREVNMRQNNSRIDEFRMINDSNSGDQISKNLVVMGNELVRAMIEPGPNDRPPIGVVLKHPIFWPKKEQLSFLADVSDRLDIKDDPVGKNIELGRRKVIGLYGWKQYLSEALRDDLDGRGTKHRSYNEKTLKDLLRVIRNKKNHNYDCSDELKREFGQTPDEFLDYFTSRFPELIVHVYKSMQMFKSEPKFRDYYDPSEDKNYWLKTEETNRPGPSGSINNGTELNQLKLQNGRTLTDI